jgi:hypothetical protein
MTITVSITDASSEADTAAATLAVDAENTRRTNAAAEDETPTLLPTAPAAALKASYETVLAASLDRSHQRTQTRVAEKTAADGGVKDLWQNASSAQRAAALAALA